MKVNLGGRNKTVLMMGLGLVVIILLSIVGRFELSVFLLRNKSVSANNLTSLFDMRKYGAAEDAKAAFENVYASGMDVCPLLAYLDQNSAVGRTGMDFDLDGPHSFGGQLAKEFLTKEFGFLNVFTDNADYILRVDRGNNNTDAWRVHIHFATSCKLLDAQFRLNYVDDNFAMRHLPFKFEYFDDGVIAGAVYRGYPHDPVVHALMSLIHSHEDSYEYLDTVLKGAGAVFRGDQSGSPDKTGVRQVLYNYYPAYDIGHAYPPLVQVTVNPNGTVEHITHAGLSFPTL